MPTANPYVGVGISQKRLFSTGPGFAEYCSAQTLLVHSDSGAENEVVTPGQVAEFSSSQAPAYLDSSLRAVSLADSSMYYVHTRQGLFAAGRVTACLYGTVVSCRLIPLPQERKTLVYAYVDQDMLPIYTDILVATNAAFSGSYGYYCDQPAQLASVVHDVDYARSKVGKQPLSKMIRDAPSEKVSATHHEHFYPREIWSALSETGRERAYTVTRLGFLPHKAMLAGLLLWLETLPENLYRLIERTDLFDSPSVKAFSAIGKKISVKAKQVQNLLVEDLRPIFEIDVLVNRITTDVDWASEKTNRTAPVLADMSYDEVYKAASAMLSANDNAIRKPKKVGWRDFWANRWQWSASGSVYSTYRDDDQYVVKDQSYRNKFVTLNLMPNYDFVHFAGRKPALEARASVKYEWGKVRAIYGCDLTSYIMSTFAFMGCEDALPSMFPVGSKSNAKFVSSRVSAMLESALPFTLDFEDFNSQHSIPAMQAVLNAYLDVNDRYLTQDQLDAGAWTVKSLNKAIVHNNLPGQQGSYQAKGTLFSGWRLTSFVNTVLNKVYTDKILAGSTRSGTLHNGDDVLVATRNFATAVAAVRGSRQYGVRLQPSKTAFGSIAEFLRVDHKSPNGGQYTTRSIATMVHSRIESGPSTDLRTALESYESRYGDFIARTGRIDIVVRLRAISEPRLSELFRTHHDVAEGLRVTHRSCGGLSQSREASIDLIYDAVSTDPDAEWTSEAVRVASSCGVRSYARELSKLLELENHLPQFIRKIGSATVGACTKRRQKIVPRENKEIEAYTVYRALYKVHSYLSTKADYGKAKLVGMAIEVLGNYEKGDLIRRHLARSATPLRTLNMFV